MARTERFPDQIAVGDARHRPVPVRAPKPQVRGDGQAARPDDPGPVPGADLRGGYVVETEGIRGYHSGDSLVYDGLADARGTDPFDVLFLPINGRDPARGVAGNMSAAEAVTLAAAIRPRFVVPHHYDMFTFNTVPVRVFEGEARRLPEGVTPRVLRCGERWEVKR